MLPSTWSIKDKHQWYKLQTKFATIILLYFLLFSCQPLRVVHITSSEFDTSEVEVVDERVQNMIEPYKLKLDESMEIELAILKEDLLKEQPESTLGNHISEISFWSASQNSDKEIDFAISNYGGLRVPYVNKGPLKVKDAYQIMPFDNYVVIMELEGSVIQQLFNHMAKVGGWPIHYATYNIKDGKAIDIRIQGKEFDISDTYILALTDYLALGGDKLSFLKEHSFENTNVYLRDAIQDFWKDMHTKGEEIFVEKDGRVKIL